MSSSQVIVKNAQLMGRDGLVDITILNGSIDSVMPSGSAEYSPTPATQVLDVNGRLVIPGFVNPHMHLDKAYALDSGLIPGNSLNSAIQQFFKWSRQVSPEVIYNNSRKVAEQAVLHGTIALRTHVTINPEIGMTWLNEHIKLRDEMADNIEIQLVLFPSNIGENQHFVENLLLETRQQAVKILGCAPSVDPDPQRSINALFELAGKYDCDIDVHIDETDDPTINALELLAQRKIELGFTGSVNAAHCCSLSAMSECDSQRIIQKVADAGIHITTLPSCNLYLMGRMDKGLVRRGLTRVKELVSAGVTVAFGSDNIRDAFNPFGKADMLQEALITAHALQLGTPDEQDLLFNMATYNAARILSLNNYGLEPGCIGTLVVLDDKDWGSAVAKESTRLYVINRGRLVAQTTIHQELLLQSF